MSELLTPCTAHQWIRETPAYKKRFYKMSDDAQRLVLAQPITRFDVENPEAMNSIFDKVEDLIAETHQDQNLFWVQTNA